MIRRILAILTAVSFVVLVSGGSGAASAADGENVDRPAAVHFLVDVSGSMSGSKLLEAKTSLLATSSTLEASGVQVGLRSFAGSCGSPGSLLVPVGPFDSESFEAAVNGLQAGGGTPTSAALRLAAADFPSDVVDRTLVLIADGDDGCGNLCVTAQELMDEGLNVRIQAVGIQVGSAAEESLSCAAHATGGEYFSVNDLDGLSAVIDRALGSGLVIRALPIQWKYIDKTSTALVEVLVVVEYPDGRKAAGAMVEFDGRRPLPVGADGTRRFNAPVDPRDASAQVYAELDGRASSIEVDLYQVDTLLQCSMHINPGDGAALGNLFGLLLPSGVAFGTIKAYLDGLGGFQEVKESGGITYTGGFVLGGGLLSDLYVYSVGTQDDPINVFSADPDIVGNLQPDGSLPSDGGSPLAHVGRYVKSLNCGGGSGDLA